ncbi:SMP-30/gluconolactonase/LRE family protein [Kitasatospora sp. NPDC088134]|uniref:SMP-30/gluconolactonase/LRE family protein n=1 Tax=Kitasatospora sp. NPDC088134 TaxID=3364071 RepID=UPI00380B60E7
MNPTVRRTPLPRARLGECPRLDAATNTLSWVDLAAGQLWLARARPGAAEPVDEPVLLAEFPGKTGCAVRAGDGEDWLVAHGGLVRHWRPGVEPATAPVVARLEQDPGPVRLNDGAVDPQGRLWVDSIPYGPADAGNPQARLHLLDTDGTSHVLLDGMLVGNGIGWSPDGALAYAVDTENRRIHRLRTDLPGLPRPELPPLTVPQGLPDGLAVDDEGCLWVALWDGGAMLRLDPEGKELDRIELPCSRPTACAFVGEHLVITTAVATGEDASGWTYTAEVGITGPAARRAALPATV